MRIVVLDEFNLNSIPPCVTLHFDRILFDDFVEFIEQNLNQKIYFFLKNEVIMKVLGDNLPISIINDANYVYHKGDIIFIIKDEFNIWRIEGVEL